MDSKKIILPNGKVVEGDVGKRIIDVIPDDINLLVAKVNDKLLDLTSVIKEDFGEIREATRVKPEEEMIEFTPQIDPTSKKKEPYNILVMINGVGFGTNKGEKFLVPRRLATEVYRLISEVNAVLHAHPFYCVLRSLLDDSDVVTSYTSEGAMFLPEFSFCEGEPGSKELADAVTYAMTKYHTTAVVVRGHGIFCVGRTMDEAYLRCVVAEHECKLWYYRHMVDIHGDS